MTYPPSWYSTQHCLWSRNLFHSKISVATSPCSQNSHVLPCFPPFWKQLAWQNSGMAFEYLQHQLGGNTLQGQNKVLQEVVYAVNQCQIRGTPTAHVLNTIPHGPRNKGVEMGVAPLTISINDPLAKFLFPFHATVCSAGIEAFSPKGVWTIFSNNTSDTKYVWGFSHSKQFSNQLSAQYFWSILVLSRVSVRFHMLKGSVPQGCPYFTHQSQVLALPSFWLTGYKLWVPTTPSSGSIIC